jgi:hypothetical protein
MSEYQWVHFQAVDRPLDDHAFEFKQRQSTRAQISRWEFTNEYHFGEFHGDAAEMLRRGYDVHLHFANYGIRTLQFRLPHRPGSAKEFEAFEVDDAIVWAPDGKGSTGILTVMPEADAGTFGYLMDVEEYLRRIVPARAMLVKGDLRPLYLFWLVNCYDDEQMEPPVPAGLSEAADGSNDALAAIAEFYEIPSVLLEVAAEESPPAPIQTDSAAIIRKWMKTQNKAELQNALESVLTGDSSVNSLLNEIRHCAGESPWPMSPPKRTRRELGLRTQELERVQKEKEDSARRAARQKELDIILKNPRKVISEIESFVLMKSSTGYHAAARRLHDLSEALGRDFANQHVANLIQRYAKYTALKRVLRQAGFHP